MGIINFNQSFVDFRLLQLLLACLYVVGVLRVMTWHGPKQEPASLIHHSHVRLAQLTKGLEGRRCNELWDLHISAIVSNEVARREGILV